MLLPSVCGGFNQVLIVFHIHFEFLCPNVALQLSLEHISSKLTVGMLRITWKPSYQPKRGFFVLFCIANVFKNLAFSVPILKNYRTLLLYKIFVVVKREKNNSLTPVSFSRNIHAIYHNFDIIYYVKMQQKYSFIKKGHFAKSFCNLSWMIMMILPK